MKARDHNWRVKSAVMSGWVVILVVALVLGLGIPASAQLPAQNLTPAPDDSPTPAEPSLLQQPSAVSRLLPEPWSADFEAIETAPIYLDGRTLFRVTAPVVADRATGPSPAEVRAQEIQQRINTFAREAANQDSTVVVDIDQPSNLPVVSVEGKLLLTVTNLDAQFSGYATPSDRAVALSEILQMSFRRYWQERQPEFLWRQAKIAGGIVVIAILLQLWAKQVANRLHRRQIRLTQARTQLGQAQGTEPMVEGPTTLNVSSVYELLKARLANRQKRKINDAERGIVALFQLVLWVGSLLWILALFPYSRWLTTLLLQWLKVPAKILLVGGLAYVAVRVSSLVIDRVGLALQNEAHWAPEKSRRLSLRFSTFSQVAKGLAGSVIFAIMGLVWLAIAGVQVGPLLAGAGIIGVGISLAAQSLIKDFINGFFILFEDHFGVGDVITVQGMSGMVELINLRITQLRDNEGRLITIPNSQISIVQNASKEWAQVDLSVSVAATADVDKALALMAETAIALSQEEDWQPCILEPPDVLGIEGMDHLGVTLRLLLKTQPLRQWVVARELRGRIKQRFDEAGIAIAVPQMAMSLKTNGLHNSDQDSPAD
ncbi:MAG: mechanosensitive ion channel family protein [Phormidesmis sp.]